MDVTDQVLGEEALLRSQKRTRFLAHILDDATQPLAVAYPDGRIMTYNTSFCDMTGYSKEELRKIKRFTDIIPSKWHDEMQIANEKMIQTGEPQRYEKEYLRKDGTTFPVEVIEYPLFDNKGNLQSYYSFYNDLNKRKQIESIKENQQRFEAICDNAPVMIYGLDPNGYCYLWNNECKKRLGWGKHEVMGKNNPLILMFPDPDEYERAKKMHDQADKIFHELNVHLKDGSKQVQSWASFRLPDHMIISIGYNINKWKREEERLQTYTSQLKEANEELSQYNYIVSHDLRSPLNAMKNYIDFLREDLERNLSDDHKAFLIGLDKAIQEAREMVEDLLTFSRIGGLVSSIERIEVKPFLNELIASMKLPTNVHVSLKDDMPDLSMERRLLRQVFQNLIDNAIKFNHSPHKLVEIGWRSIDEEHYEFSVRDNGIGIKPQYRDQIFGVFERLHTRDEFPGTGIGLAIVQKIIQKVGGSIRLESEPGDGSTFFVTLPKVQQEG